MLCRIVSYSDKPARDWYKGQDFRSPATSLSLQNKLYSPPHFNYTKQILFSHYLIVMLNYKPQTEMYKITWNVDVFGKVDVLQSVFLKKMAGAHNQFPGLLLNLHT